jgi:hypothetical protein
MAYVEGTTPREYLNRQRTLPLDEAAQIAKNP